MCRNKKARRHIAVTTGSIINNRVSVCVEFVGRRRCMWDLGLPRARWFQILRKEVIQPQVPLRLPCYDLVPITGFIFGACLAAPATSDAPRFGGLTGGVYKAQEHIHRGMLIRDY